MSDIDNHPHPGQTIGKVLYTGKTLVTDERTIAITLAKAISMLADLGLGLELHRNFRRGPRHHPPRPRGVRQPARNP